ncbi:MAG: DUF853 domain-containing protein [Ignavibacteriales bacterium]|nr:DUF853 domain-containing protein [Ignavibacteriales bacterium]
MAERFSRIGVPGLHGRRQGRPVRASARPAATSPRSHERVGQLEPRRLRLRRLPGGLLGPLRRAGPPGAHHRLRHGAAAARAPPQPQRRPRAGSCNLVFKVADDSGLLPARPQGPAGHGSSTSATTPTSSSTEYGNVSPASIGAIQRGLLTLERAGRRQFFGEPALDLDDLMQTDAPAAASSTSSPPTS